MVPSDGCSSPRTSNSLLVVCCVFFQKKNDLSHCTSETCAGDSGGEQHIRHTVRGLLLKVL